MFGACDTTLKGLWVVSAHNCFLRFQWSLANNYLVSPPSSVVIGNCCVAPLITIDSVDIQTASVMGTTVLNWDSKLLEVPGYSECIRYVEDTEKLVHFAYSGLMVLQQSGRVGNIGRILLNMQYLCRNLQSYDLFNVLESELFSTCLCKKWTEDIAHKPFSSYLTFPPLAVSCCCYCDWSTDMNFCTEWNTLSCSFSLV